MISKIAERLYAQMETATRDDGTRFWRRKEDAEEALADLIQDAHMPNGWALPDDHRYEMVARVLAAIADEDAETADDLDAPEIWDGIVPVYAAELTAWLDSSIRRIAYVDDAVDEFGWSNLNDALMRGYYTELTEVGLAVIESLEAIAEDEADEE